jgi:anti-repressor protein
MTSLIPILNFHGQEGIQAVSARALYAFLHGEDTSRHFTRWAEKYITTNEWAIRGEDWVVCATVGANPEGGRPAQDYHLRLDFAKHIALQAHTERGQEVRTYFIAVEKRAREMSVIDRISRKDLALLILAAEEAKERAEKALEAAAPAVQFHAAVTASEDFMNLKTAAAILAIPGLGQNNLFKFLREWEILMADNLPYRRHIESGCFKVQEYPNRYKVGHILKQTMVSQKGLDLILRTWNKAAADAAKASAAG